MELFEGEDPFRRAASRAALEAFLQSPHFVYRVESGAGPAEGGLIRAERPRDRGQALATSLELDASDALLEAAKAGELSTREAVRAYAGGMLDDPRAREVVGAFHRQLYDYEQYHDLNKDQALYPEFVPEMGDDMQREAERFVDHVVFDEEGGLTEPAHLAHGVRERPPRGGLRRRG